MNQSEKLQQELSAIDIKINKSEEMKIEHYELYKLEQQERNEVKGCNIIE